MRKKNFTTQSRTKKKKTFTTKSQIKNQFFFTFLTQSETFRYESRILKKFKQQTKNISRKRSIDDIIQNAFKIKKIRKSIANRKKKYFHVIENISKKKRLNKTRLLTINNNIDLTNIQR